MSYIPTEWKAGDTVTSAKLNKMEQGIANHNMIEGILNNENSIMTLNKTWQEIWDNNFTTIVFLHSVSSIKQFMYIQGFQIDNGAYNIITAYPGGSAVVIFTCNSPDDYPSYSL